MYYMTVCIFTSDMKTHQHSAVTIQNMTEDCDSDSQEYGYENQNRQTIPEYEMMMMMIEP